MKHAMMAMACAALAGSAPAWSAPVSSAMAVAAPTPLVQIDLSQPFGAPAGWSFTAVEDDPMPDPIMDPADQVPGVIRLCIGNAGGRTCRPDLDRLLAISGPDDLFSRPHFLLDARIVHPRADLPMLLVKVASLHSVNGDQRIATAAIAYDRADAAFAVIYRHQTGRNNNQDTRYIATGPLRGAIISAEPTDNAPFAFWIAVNRIAADHRYHQVLRYRSATRYGDGNPLAVIDSEMPNLLHHLGLWHPGSRLPLPATRCPQPHLIGATLWCTAKTAVPPGQMSIQAGKPLWNTMR
jgi:hypothetical protein